MKTLIMTYNKKIHLWILREWDILKVVFNKLNYLSSKVQIITAGKTKFLQSLTCYMTTVLQFNYGCVVLQKFQSLRLLDMSQNALCRNIIPVSRSSMIKLLFTKIINQINVCTC